MNYLDLEAVAPAPQRRPFAGAVHAVLVVAYPGVAILALVLAHRMPA